jgi:serine protease Do
MHRIALVVLSLVFLTAASLHAQVDPKLAQELYERATPALIVVQFTYEGELGRRDLNGTGIVVSDDGLVAYSIGLSPVQVPDEQMTNFKIIIPGDDEIEIDAVFQGRDERTNLAFIKAKDPKAHEWKPIAFEDIPVSVGEQLYSIGLLPKDSAYKSFMLFPKVSATLRGPVPQVLVGGDGLTPVGSPVFNSQGKAVGMVHAQSDQSPLLDDPRDPYHAIMTPPRFFTPARDFILGLEDPPKADEPMKMPHIGVSSLSGLSKEVSEYFDLKDQPAVQVGDVIPDFPAAKAGLKAGDVIVKMNGQPLERGDQPEETPMIMTRKIQRMQVGQPVTFSVLRSKDKSLEEIKVTLAERPKQQNKAARFWAEDLGFSTREVVFDDTYQRRLSADTKGVIVALVKPGSSAHEKLRNGDLITQLNQIPVEGLEQFKEQYQEFRKTNPTDAVVFEVLRGVNTQVIRIEPPQ